MSFAPAAWNNWTAKIGTKMESFSQENQSYQLGSIHQVLQRQFAFKSVTQNNLKRKFSFHRQSRRWNWQQKSNFLVHLETLIHCSSELPA